MDPQSASIPKPPAGELFPPTEPYNSGFLTVSGIHEIFYEEYGNKDGNPILYL
jgi:proline iminopeptidase